MIPLVAAFLLSWRFVPADANPVVAMHWKRVLNSPLSADVRREIPPQAASVLASINFIEGIEHVVWTPGLVVLEGEFDLDGLKDMAKADGGSVDEYKKTELLTPGEAASPHVGLVSSSVILLGSEETIKAAVDRGEKSKLIGPAGFDLWVRTSGPSFQLHDFGLQIGESVRITSKLRFHNEQSALLAVDNSEAFGLASSHSGVEASISGYLSPEQFRKRQWRTAMETLQSPESERPSSHPGVIRIYGLDGGVKEIPIK